MEDPASLSARLQTAKTQVELMSSSARQAQLKAELALLQSQSLVLPPSASMLEEQLAAMELESQQPLLQSELSSSKPKPEPAEPDCRGSPPPPPTVAEMEREMPELDRLTREAKAKASMTPSQRKIAELEAQLAEVRKNRAQPPPAKVNMSNEYIETFKLKLLTYQYGIDLVLVIDCTSVMKAWLDEVKDKLLNIITEILEIPQNAIDNEYKLKNKETNRQPLAIVRVAFVGYRDHCDGADRLSVHDFVESNDAIELNNLKSFILNQEAEGGGDTPEDIAGALNECLTLSWKSSTKLVVHIADAPCHGIKFHDCDDNYPDGDPYNLDPLKIIEQFAQYRINYFFVQIDACTVKMTELFQKAYKGVTETRPVKKSTFKVLSSTSNAKDFASIVLLSVRLSSKAGRDDL